MLGLSFNSQIQLLFVMFCVLLVCECVLLPGDNSVAVNKYIIIIINTVCLNYKDRSVNVVTYLGQQSVCMLKILRNIHRATVALSTYYSSVYLWQFELPIPVIHLNVLRHIHRLYSFLLQVPISKVNVSLISLALLSGNLERPILI
jgi:hypothetical protein